MTRIVLIQARDADDPMLEHELQCFVRATGVERERFFCLNLAEHDPSQWSWPEDVGAAMVGGSGDYSAAAGGFDWHQPSLELVAGIARQGLPFFASCFGFQLLVQALGGRLVSRPEFAEVGTFEMTLTEDGHSDPFFGELPATFNAQCGHNDSAAELPESTVRLASSERCENQALRVIDKPVWATQFHPELDVDANKVRYIRYLVNYADEPMTQEEAQLYADTIHAPSPHANALLARFLAAAGLLDGEDARPDIDLGRG